MNFFDELSANEERLQAAANDAVKSALSLGADECTVTVSDVKGLNVSSRDFEVENIEFNRDSDISITVHKDSKTGYVSTTDLSREAVDECIKRAIDIASYANPDPFIGLAPEALVCRDIKTFDVVYDNQVSPDLAVQKAIELEKLAMQRKKPGIVKADGADFSTKVASIASSQSNGFSSVRSVTSVASSVSLIGEAAGKKQTGYGYSKAYDLNRLYDPERIADEAVYKTARMLNSKKVPTGRYKVIFSENTARYVWSVLCSAISGGAIYRKTSFLCDRKGELVMPEYVTLHEDPFVMGEGCSRSYDGDGVCRHQSDIIKDGVLTDYLLSVYSARKLNLETNGHAGGTTTLYPVFGDGRTMSFEDLLMTAGEGIVVTGLMGQGLNMINGDFSKGAEGYYFKDGRFVHAVDGITIAGNFKDMLRNISFMADDVDERTSVKTGSLLIEGMTVSGS